MAEYRPSFENVQGRAFFQPAPVRQNLASGENIAVSFGKIKKWLDDLGDAAFTDVSSSYSSSGTDPINGTAVASALSGYALADMSNAASATTTAKGAVMLSSAFNDDSQTKAATPYTIKKISETIANIVDSGPKNILPFNLTDMKAGNSSAGYTWNDNVCTISDGASLNITVTVNDDNTIVATGSKPATSSGLNFRIVPAANGFNLPIGDYVLSGCPSGGSSSTYQIRALINNSSVFAQDIGSSGEFTTTAKLIERVEIVFGTSAMSNFNLTFKPMICLKDYWAVSHNFAPFTPSNYQLYELIKSYHP